MNNLDLGALPAFVTPGFLMTLRSTWLLTIRSPSVSVLDAHSSNFHSAFSLRCLTPYCDWTLMSSCTFYAKAARDLLLRGINTEYVSESLPCFFSSCFFSLSNPPSPSRWRSMSMTLSCRSCITSRHNFYWASCLQS